MWPNKKYYSRSGWIYFNLDVGWFGYIPFIPLFLNLEKYYKKITFFLTFIFFSDFIIFLMTQNQ